MTRADARGRPEHDGQAPVPPEPLREQVFAACGYAFALGALGAGVLAPRLGAAALFLGVLLAVLLVPVSVLAIRRFARTRCRAVTGRAARQSPAGKRPEAPSFPRGPDL